MYKREGMWGTQTGFFVAATNKDILAKVTDLMKRHGYIGMVDTAGRVHYLIDGRDNAYKATASIQSVLEVREQSSAVPAADPDRLPGVVDAVLYQAGISPHLKGHQCLRYILLRLAGSPHIPPVSKVYYPELAAMDNGTSAQVDRAIRYASRRSRWPDLSNTRLIMTLNQLVCQRLMAEGVSMDTASNQIGVHAWTSSDEAGGASEAMSR